MSLSLLFSCLDTNIHYYYPLQQLQKVLNLYLVASGFQNKSAPAIKKTKQSCLPVTMIGKQRSL
ncbi:hypothetical protein Hdeb2414_s0008g00288031 [Helianthus debilis subsp. tardiflorus]